MDALAAELMAVVAGRVGVVSLSQQEGVTCMGVAMRVVGALRAGRDPRDLPVLREAGEEWQRLQAELGCSPRAAPSCSQIHAWARKQKILYCEGLQQTRRDVEAGKLGLSLVYLPAKERSAMGHVVVMRVEQKAARRVVTLGTFVDKARGTATVAAAGEKVWQAQFSTDGKRCLACVRAWEESAVFRERVEVKGQPELQGMDRIRTQFQPFIAGTSGAVRKEKASVQHLQGRVHLFALQVLCGECTAGESARDETPPVPEEEVPRWDLYPQEMPPPRPPDLVHWRRLGERDEPMQRQLHLLGLAVLHVHLNFRPASSFAENVLMFLDADVVPNRRLANCV
jgi:hypothetical protein